MTTDDETLLSGYTGRLLLSVSLGWGVMQGGRLILSPLLPAIRGDLGLTNAQAGFIFTVLWGLYAVLQYPSGRLSDRLSRKTLLVAGTALAVVGFAALSQAGTYLALLLGASVVGLGVGLYPTAARALVSDLFRARRGQAFGLHTASGDLGGVAAAGAATVVLAVGTWQGAFLPIAGLLAVVVLSVHRFSDEPYAVSRVDLAIGTTLRRLLADARLRWLLIAYSLFAVTWQSTTAFLPTYLASRGFPPAFANAGFAALFVVGAAVKPIAGWLGDRFDRRLVAIGALLVGAATLALVALTDEVVLVGAGVVLFAAGLMSYPPVMQAHLMDGFPDESMGGDLGGMRSIYIAVGAIGPTVAGAIADVAGWPAAFSGLVGCLVAAALIISLRDYS